MEYASLEERRVLPRERREARRVKRQVRKVPAREDRRAYERERREKRAALARQEAHAAKLAGAKTVEQRRAARVHAERERRARVQGSRPTLDVKLARSFAQILLAGVPPLDALRYLAPEHHAKLDERARTKWLNNVAGSQLVLDAINELQGGEWHTLEPEKRLQLALDKHLAELAHLLYTNQYERADSVLTAKMDTAAKRLTDYLTESPDDSESPWRRFVEDFMKASQSGVEIPTIPVINQPVRES